MMFGSKSGRAVAPAENRALGEAGSIDSREDPSSELGGERDQGALEAIVVGNHEVVTLAARALSVFRPGFRVATARDLEGATQWLEILRPSLVLVEGKLIAEDVLGYLHFRHLLAARTCGFLIIGSSDVLDESDVLENDFWIPAPIRLSTLLAAVRSIVP